MDVIHQQKQPLAGSRAKIQDMTQRQINVASHVLWLAARKHLNNSQKKFRQTGDTVLLLRKTDHLPLGSQGFVTCYCILQKEEQVRLADTSRPNQNAVPCP